MDPILYIHHNIGGNIVMPLPEPGKREGRENYVARCMKKFKADGSDLPRKQQLAACYDKYRKSKSRKAKAKKKPKGLAQELRKLATYYNSNRIS